MARLVSFTCIALCLVTVLIACAGTADYEFEVGTGYKLIRTSGHNVRIVPKDGNDGTKKEIPAKVIELAWNNRYIAAKTIGLKNAYSDELNNSYKIPDESQINYWILDTSDNILYGAYEQSQFYVKLKELELFDQFVLQDVSYYRKNK